MRWSAAQRAFSSGVKAFTAKVGPLELATLLIVAGVYLLARAIWPEGAAGLALLVGGLVSLGIALLRALPPRPMKKEPQG